MRAKAKRPLQSTSEKKISEKCCLPKTDKAVILNIFYTYFLTVFFFFTSPIIVAPKRDVFGFRFLGFSSVQGEFGKNVFSGSSFEPKGGQHFGAVRFGTVFRVSVYKVTHY